MPRRPRNPADDCIYHVLNRGNCRMDIFSKDADFAAFIKLIEEARQRFPAVRILGYCLMHNHWHQVLWPRRGEDLSRFVGWLSSTHVRRWREHRGAVGEGHLYQGRYKSFIVQDDEHLVNLLRYVEGNPLRAKMVRHAVDWPWSSLGRGPGVQGAHVQLSAWPVDRPRDWARRVDQAVGESTLQSIRTSIQRGRPFGDAAWTRRIVSRFKLDSTMRDPWRPRKSATVAEDRAQRR